MDTQQNIQDRKGLERVTVYLKPDMEITAHLFHGWRWLLSPGWSVGAVSSIFAHALKKAVTGFRMESLGSSSASIAGLCIVFLYQKFGKNDGGTNQVLSAIHYQDNPVSVSAL